MMRSVVTPANISDNPGSFSDWLHMFPNENRESVLARYSAALTNFNRYAKWLEEHPHLSGDDYRAH
jgi:hypothetical protein